MSPITVKHVVSVPTDGVENLSFAFRLDSRENIADVIV